MNSLQKAGLCLTAIALPALVFAQQKTHPDPADSRISVPPAIYVSPLKQYQPLGDEQIAPWKSVNDTVEKIGGWKVYAKEASDPGYAQPARPDPQPAPQMKPPAQSGHSGHKRN